MKLCIKRARVPITPSMRFWVNAIRKFVYIFWGKKSLLLNVCVCVCVCERWSRTAIVTEKQNGVLPCMCARIPSSYVPISDARLSPCCTHIHTSEHEHYFTLFTVLFIQFILCAQAALFCLLLIIIIIIIISVDFFFASFCCCCLSLYDS